MDYAKTLNLPKTDFSMRANLPQKEPVMLENQAELYNRLMERNQDKPLFVFHDGPPYANGDIHLGHALNKSLKDIIVRYKNMTGFKAPYIHGWDTHGLPIEQQAIKKLGVNRHEVGAVKFRETCREFALKYVGIQKKQMQRLGVLGDWDNSYVTLDPKFEAKQIRIFGEMSKKGYIYKGMKPVYWCPSCETALAEAEIEYNDHKVDSIYVKFRIKEDKNILKAKGIDINKAYFVIWTTTTWTLPGNVAISLNPEFMYSILETNGEHLIVASELVETFCKAAGISSYTCAHIVRGSEFEHVVCAHPFLDSDSVIIVGDHVTAQAGTGCVHTAPGHGAEDFEACLNYSLPIPVPVDARGFMNELAGQFCGMHYKKSVPAILDELKESGALVAMEGMNHQYPHCWRCREPIVFRATPQWFASVDGFKEQTIEQIKTVKWFPSWGEDRITAMVRDRYDWCISRQRIWGVPIPIFYCCDCEKELINDETINAVAELFAEKGSNAWFEMEAEDILPKGTKCACGCDRFNKETDIMDVWFDSGTSHSGVLEVKEGLRFPADLYLEGNDQYRGWFQSSLLTSVAAKGVAPYKTVVTHGFTVDGEGRKMSKSLGNGVDPADIIKEYGADILRLWVASCDYKSDMRISKDILKQLSEAYRKLRNTARFILGNISDFEPDLHSSDNLSELDMWALARFENVLEKCAAAYEVYDFHVIYHALHNFCVVDMSNFYLDILKDCLYCEEASSGKRRAAQTAMYKILDGLVRVLSPILAFTTQEIWQAMPHSAKDDSTHVLLNDIPSPADVYRKKVDMGKWDFILAIRADAQKALEEARSSKAISGNSLSAKIVMHTDSELPAVNWEEILIVSKAEVTKDECEVECFKGETGIKFEVLQADGRKCERCWMYSDQVDDSDLCPRCADLT